MGVGFYVREVVVVDEFDEYKIIIEDMPPTREDIIRKINKIIRENKFEANTPKGIEIDVPPEWKDILQNNGSILWEYEKIGWRVMWYNQGFRNKPTRSWLSFRNPNNKGVR